MLSTSNYDESSSERDFWTILIIHVPATTFFPDLMAQDDIFHLDPLNCVASVAF